MVDLDGDGLLSEEEEQRVNDAIAEGSSEIDSRVGVKYPTPLAAEHRTPVLLRRCADVIAYILTDDGDVLSETVYSRYKSAVQWACDVGKGKARLGDEEKKPKPRIAAARRDGPSRNYTRKKLSGVL